MSIPPTDTLDELTDEELELVVGGMRECRFQKYIVEILNTQRTPPHEPRAIITWGSGNIDS